LSKHTNNIITVFEHQSLYTHKGEYKLDESLLLALQTFYGEKGVPYFSLVHKGVQFCEYVGVVQVGKTCIEILPKADKSNDIESWRTVLIGMLKAVGVFDIHAPSNADLNLKRDSILDLYFEWFVNESEQLLHKGLAKRYHKTEGNNTALKGTIQFGKHIQQNLTHQERFFVRCSIYDREHPLNCVLFKTIKLLQNINTNISLNSRIGKLLLDFPEMPDIRVSDAFFERIQYNRKTETYKKAIDIARLLLLNYHPDIINGKNDVMALMFDMNLLWEQFVYVSLRKNKPLSFTIATQSSKDFWKPNSGYRQKMRPDIIINKDKPNCVVLDTKWKNLNGQNPSPDDLRQMYAYSKFHGDAKCALVYPGEENKYTGGTFLNESDGKETMNECGVHILQVNKNIKKWQLEIKDELLRK